jgi:hypothetical protein
MPLNRNRLAIIAAAIAGLVSACSNTSGTPQPAQQQNAMAAATSTSDSAPTASVEDFAAVVAEHHADWDKTVTDLEALCLDPATVPACHLTYMTVSLKAETIRLALSTVHKPDAPGYVGAPPEEIEDLLTETESAADAASVAANDLVEAAGCDDPFADTCIEQRFAADGAIDDLSGKLDAWTAYS